MERMISCEQAKNVDLVDFLLRLGHSPQKISNNDYWYLSPLRNENTASFKVNRKLNVWFDFGTGQGGNLIDYGIQYFQCSVSELLHKMKDMGYHHDLSFYPYSPLLPNNQAASPGKAAGEKKESQPGKIVVLEASPLRSPVLLGYLAKRCISPEVANFFCKQVFFELNGKRQFAIGFLNNAGGYELRNEYFKGSSSPKGSSFIDNDQQNLAVFEGFFSFLSFQQIARDYQLPPTNYLVLNSLAFFQKARSTMEQYRQVHLYLDQDAAGIQHVLQALQWDKERYIDRSHFYKRHKDLNDWLINSYSPRQEVARKGRRL